MLMNLLDGQPQDYSRGICRKEEGPGQAEGVGEFRKASKTQTIVWRCKRSQLSGLLPVINGWAGSCAQELLKLRKPPGMNSN